MFYITGDLHGEYDIHKLSSKRFPMGNNLTRDDYLIICGDFGLVWNNGNSEMYWRDWLNSKPWTTLFIDGNHEKFPLLNRYPITQKWGGKVHQIEDNIYHLMRGQVFEIDGKTFFTMGGASSHDIQYRTKNVDWWEEELPNEAEMQEELANLDKYNWKVDCVITHCAPTGFIATCINMGYSPDTFTEYLQHIDDKLDYEHWYMGHYHLDAIFGSDSEKQKHILYNYVDVID